MGRRPSGRSRRSTGSAPASASTTSIRTTLRRTSFVDGQGDETLGYDVEDLGAGTRRRRDRRALAGARQGPLDRADLEDSRWPTRSPRARPNTVRPSKRSSRSATTASFSLSIYPVKDMTLDAERNSFGELAAIDRRRVRWKPVAVRRADIEHLTARRAISPSSRPRRSSSPTQFKRRRRRSTAASSTGRSRPSAAPAPATASTSSARTTNRTTSSSATRA